ncbi:MAG TPA: replication initiator [Actinospica sp.]|nr:replication initiator [Actinospica sp.]
MVVGVSGLELSVNAFGSEFRGWVRELERLGGCSSPVYLMGHSITRDAQSGAVLHAFYSADLPFGVLMLPCRNRRQGVCLPCSLIHNGDSFHIVRAGMVGGKGVPASVLTHPYAFVTVTAPSFGAVHRIGKGGRCHPNREQPSCEHGRSGACWASHVAGDPLLGGPLCFECYRYQDAVVWNAAAGLLWVQYVNRLKREMARLGGLTIRSGEVRQHLRVSYVKVTEFQRRGAVHFHAIVRVDGPDGPDDAPPAWASAELLAEAAKAAGPRTTVGVPTVGGDSEVIGLGAELDAKQVNGAESAVSSYLAKYITKDDGHGLILPRRLLTRKGIDFVPRGQLTEHARTLMRCAWDLGGLPEMADLRLRQWSHQLAFRGNVVTKSRLYSTTYGELRAARAAHVREAAGLSAVDAAETVKESHWRFVGAGHSPLLAEIAEGIAEETAMRKGPRPDWIDTGGDA